MDKYKYVTEYKGYIIYQDIETGYFYAPDKDDNVFSREATQALVRCDIDRKCL